MKQSPKQKLPRGWTQERIRKLAHYYDNQTEEERVAELEAAWKAENVTMVAVPTELVPQVLRLIARKRGA
jgi:predicted dinucleotide-binding enzyme